MNENPFLSIYPVSCRFRIKSEFIRMTKQELFSNTDLVASCGGILGLFLGISLISFVEFVYFRVIRPIFNLGKGKKCINRFGTGPVLPMTLLKWKLKCLFCIHSKHFVQGLFRAYENQKSGAAFSFVNIVYISNEYAYNF